MPYPSKPILKSTEKEYLLFIHPASKERAKVVSGYSWDARRGCWVYPRTNKIYDALISEFGDELKLETPRVPEVAEIQKKQKSTSGSQSAEATKAPEPKDQKELDDLQHTNKALQAEICKLRESIDAIARGNNGKHSDEEVIHPELLAQEKEIESLRQRLAATTDELQKSKMVNESLSIEASGLRTALKARSSNGSNENVLKDIALEATGNDKKFSLLLSRLRIDQSLPLLVHKQLEVELRSALAIEQADRSYDMFQLIQQVSDEGILPKDAADLAHTIRKQRNIIAHADTYEKTYQARIIICLLAAALLWPELPE